ncbi:MAG: DUF2807 domain-containing protein [Paramuribaculum sp.]|nr:DUF2807 domain-containing protein [Paramuribaculum sp.]
MKLTFLSSVLLALTTCSCTNSSLNFTSKKTIDSSIESPIITRTINVKDVSEIECSRAVTVLYEQGPSTSVTLSAPSDIADLVIVESKGATLHCTVDQEYHIKNGMDRVVVTVVSPSVTSFEATTAGTIKAQNYINLDKDEIDIETTTAATVIINKINCKALDCNSSTAGTITVTDITCHDMVKANASTGSSINLSGNATTIDFDASTGANINASKLSANEGQAKSSTGSDIDCNVKVLDKSATTGGDVSNKR